MRNVIPSVAFLIQLFFSVASTLHAEHLEAGIAKIEITDRSAGFVNDPSFAKVLALRRGNNTLLLITLDAVAVGEIGRIPSSFLPSLRKEIETAFHVSPDHVIVTASHCHATVQRDLLGPVLSAVKTAINQFTPVKAGVAVAKENRISENRRIRLKDGTEADMRRAYALPPDQSVKEIGPIDPTVGLLKLERLDGKPLAVLYHFACHPIMNPPSRGNSADFPGFASKLIEDSLGEGAIAFFVQGCAGDINPVRYKEAGTVPDAEPLGTLLGSTVLAAVAKIETKDGAALTVTHRELSLPAASNYKERIDRIEAEIQTLSHSLKPTNINFKSFFSLFVQHRIWPEAPSAHMQSYLHDQSQGRTMLHQQDSDNKVLIDQYLQNIETMEKLTRLNTNLALLRKHLKQVEAMNSPTFPTEVHCIRVGEFRLVTFPGELTVEVGLGIKRRALSENVFVAGYTNGYVYYAPTSAQLQNAGYAQEDCDTLLSPQWHGLFEEAAVNLLKNL
jgi:hypothetical protein